MSGGTFDYKYQHLQHLADEIENELERNFGGYIDDEKEDFKTLLKFECDALIRDLTMDSKRAKELEWYLSGDTGAETYLNRLKKIYSESKNTEAYLMNNLKNI